MEFGGFGDGFLVFVQRAASLGDGGVEIVDGLEMFVDQRLIDEGPQVLGRLELGTVGRLIDESDAVGHWQVFRAMPAGIVEGENNDALAPGACLPREGFEQFGKERFVDAVR